MDLQKNADRFTGADYVKLYDQYRPQAPQAILQQTITYRQNIAPELVLDLGCGTGTSTLGWSRFAKKVIGLEPSEEMLTIARSKVGKKEIEFLQGFGHDIPMQDASADIIACSQSFHWMEPKATLKEVSRVLKEGGVFVVFDCSWPPSFDWQSEQAYRNLFEKVKQITHSLDEAPAHYFDKASHLENIKESSFFRFVKENYYHHSSTGGWKRFLGLALSQGGLEALLKQGFSEKEIGLDDFRSAIQSRKNILGDTLTFHYKAIFAVK